jgi:DNA polymerase III epsilon subunit-like protein
MHYIVLDLEFNNMRDILDYYPEFYQKYPNLKENDCPNEIIEIGAVKLDRSMKTVDTLKVYVKPVIFEMLNPRIKEITGITEGDLESGVSFGEALDKLAAFSGEDCIICSWAKDDVAELIRNSNYHSCTNLDWLKRYLDIQEYCTKVLAEKKSLSLKNALDKLRVKVDESELHDALNDAVYTAEVFRRKFNSRIINNFIVSDIINMPSIIIRNYENFSLDESTIDIKCPRCKNEIEMEYPFRLFNWKFVGLGYCSSCHSKVLHEIVVKKTIKGDEVYDNKRTIIDEVEYSDYAYKLRQIS